MASNKLQKIVGRLIEGKTSQKDLDALRKAISEGKATLSAGAGSVAIGDGASGAVIITGDMRFELTAEALELLQRKPYEPAELKNLKVLPYPGDLPPSSRLPFARNLIFTGREQALLDLAKAAFEQRGPMLVTQTITGIGGIGKTQLAVEFCFRYGRFFQGVHWIDAAPIKAEKGTTSLPLMSKIQAEIAACGRAMKLANWPQEIPEQRQRTLSAWKQSGPRLVILDNLENVAVARQAITLIQEGGDLRLLITARRKSWPKNLIKLVYHLDVFDKEESINFLREYLPNKKKYSKTQLLELAERLGHLPLALELAARFIKRHRSTISDYLADLERALEHPSMDNWKPDKGSSPTKHDRSLHATFLVSWEAIKDEDAKKVFRMASWCAPNEPIPRDLLMEAAEVNEKVFSNSLIALEDAGLISFTEEMHTAILHPLVAEFGQVESIANGDTSDLERLTDLFATASLAALNEKTPQAFLPLQEHMLVIAGHADAAKLDIRTTLWNNMGSHLIIVADFDGAKSLFERALQIDEATYGPDHPTVAIDVNNLSGVLQDLGDLPGAKAHLERVLQMDEATYGPDHPTVAITLNNLGGVLQNLGDLPAAKAHFERALKIDEATYGSDHPTVAITLNNLGGVLQDLGDLPAAKANFEHALKIDEAIYGPDHPTVASRLNNLGGLQKALGDLPAAKAHYERALKIGESSFGPYHPTVATNVNNLGGVLKALGDLPAAKAHYERALKIVEATFEPDHPTVATIVNNLGGVLRALGDLPAAKAHLERALKIFLSTLPADHPSIQTVKNNIKSLDQDGEETE